MNVLILGSGGRENALAAKIAQSRYLTKLYIAPGNPGCARHGELLNIDIENFDQIKNSVINKRIEIIIVGPENPLINGISDFFKSDKELSAILVIGPGAIGAQLEGSKDFAKKFMEKYSIPTAAYKSFSKDELKEAIDFLKKCNFPIVLKADGPAAGKGVIIAESFNEAESNLIDIFNGKFGASGDKVVIEEFLKGIELSMFVLTDGKEYLLLPEAKDYKRIGEGDVGLNTGGMGSVSPVYFADQSFKEKVINRIIEPTLYGLQKESIDYCGFIFFGLINCNNEPFVIEYNVRLGDPETESILPRIESDFLKHLISAATGDLKSEVVKISDNFAQTVVIASKGYPEEFSVGYLIEGLDEIKDSQLNHFSTKISDKGLYSNGGRVISITSKGNSLSELIEKIYKDVAKVSFNNSYYRRDIGSDLIRYD